ncbi:hypothetical protein RND71_044157 [Anisodus tanguticus]|uniref:Ribosomal protein/NADH dehydrogenase domain-containing protein n=1 Tax=Anisodus tanguticus TaxID=243964 RepID=A0AAE1UU83_9SOLA|nr:hypothetical protein RND71_044157 [Anisodus tanguticus]
MQVIKFSSHLKELRIHVCNVSSHNENLRKFIQKFYKEIKEKNPEVPILIRECRQVEPKVWARYNFGKEESVSLYEKNPQQILEIVNNLASKKF